MRLSIWLIFAGAVLFAETAASSQYIAPGHGQGAMDPRQVLARTEETLAKATDIRYEAEWFGIGAWATRTKHISGFVKMSRLPAGNPYVARMAIEGLAFDGDGVSTPFRSGFEGSVVLRVQPKTKTFFRRVLSPHNADERDLSSVTRHLGGDAYTLLLLEFLNEQPFTLRKPLLVADYEGRAMSGGVLCHVVYLEYDRGYGARKERWFIGVEDWLPRRVEQLVADDQGRFGAYVLTLREVSTAPPRSEEFILHIPPDHEEHSPREPQALLALGTQAPDVRLKDPEGREHSLKDYSGRIVVIEFWATWCVPCLRTMPVLQALHDRFSEQGVVVLGLNAWETNSPTAYMERHGFTFRLLLNAEEAADLYPVPSLPTTYVIGRDGTIIYAAGFDTSKGQTALQKAVEQALTRDLPR